MIRNSSREQYKKDFADLIETGRILSSGKDNFAQLLEDILKETPNTQNVQTSGIYRNNVTLTPAEATENDKVYTKLHQDLKRSENIALKTLAVFLSCTVPDVIKRMLTNIVYVVEASVVVVNSILALIRNYGIIASGIFGTIGIFSFWFNRLFGLLVRSILLILFGLMVFAESDTSKCTRRVFITLIKFIPILVHRKEWVINI